MFPRFWAISDFRRFLPSVGWTIRRFLAFRPTGGGNAVSEAAPSNRRQCDPRRQNPALTAYWRPRSACPCSVARGGEIVVKSSYARKRPREPAEDAPSAARICQADERGGVILLTAPASAAWKEAELTEAGSLLTDARVGPAHRCPH